MDGDEASGDATAQEEPTVEVVVSDMASRDRDEGDNREDEDPPIVGDDAREAAYHSCCGQDPGRASAE